MRRNKYIGGRGVPSVLGAASIAFLVAITAFVSGCGGEQDPGSSTQKQGGTQQKTETTKSSVASIGEPITVGNAQWTVTGVQQLDKLVSRLGSAQGNFVITDITFVNNSNQDVSLATPSLSLVDSQGREFEVDVDANYKHLNPDEQMFIEQVKPGDTKEGKVIFSVAPDASGLKLQAGDATNFLSKEHGYIDLGF